jgi:superfamily II DNA helicase RecQ
VEAVVGVDVVVNGGIRGPVREVDDEGVLVDVGGSALRVRRGEPVTLEGRQVVLVPPGTLALRAALAAWRTERYKADGVPPFVVASDKLLDALALARPRSEAELLAVSGIGQAKADAYGEDVLAVITGGRREAEGAGRGPPSTGRTPS